MRTWIVAAAVVLAGVALSPGFGHEAAGRWFPAAVPLEPAETGPDILITEPASPEPLAGCSVPAGRTGFCVFEGGD